MAGSQRQSIKMDVQQAFTRVVLGLIFMSPVCVADVGDAHSIELRFFKCEDSTNFGRKIEHPDSCNKFVQCIGNNPLGSDCQVKGTVFNEKHQGCVKRFGSDDDCTIRNADRECRFLHKHGGDHVLLEHALACHRYYNCSAGHVNHRFGPFQVYEMECPYPFYWDIEKKSCLNYTEVKCGQRYAPTWICDYLSFSCSGPNCAPCYIHHPPCEGKEDGLWPNTIFEWSTFFIECIGGRSRTIEQQKCPVEKISKTKQIFHPIERKCVPQWQVPQEYGGLNPDCTDAPAGYYQLDPLDVITYSCPGEVIFYCGLPYPGHRDINLCQRMPGQKCSDGFWPSPSKHWTNRYVECKDGNYTEELECKKLAGYKQIFHPIRRRCLSPWYVPRIHGGVKPDCNNREPGKYSIVGYERVTYRCPGVILLHCIPPRLKGLVTIDEKGHIDVSGDLKQDNASTIFPNGSSDEGDYYDDDDMDMVDLAEKDNLIFAHPMPIVYAQGSETLETCHYMWDLEDRSDIAQDCPEYLPFTTKVPYLGHYWTPMFVECSQQKGQGQKPSTIKARVGICKMVDGIERVYHPKGGKCMPRYELSAANGGFTLSCDCKMTATYSIGAYAIKCPGDELFYCNPPFYLGQTSTCGPLQTYINKN